LWGNNVDTYLLTTEERECLRDWDNYTTLGKLPYELGYRNEPCHEDIEAIKTMKKWLEKRAERERKKAEAKEKMRQRMKKGI
jgi:hypothetical protein